MEVSLIYVCLTAYWITIWAVRSHLANFMEKKMLMIVL